jgi:aldose 1-epimerase
MTIISLRDGLLETSLSTSGGSVLGLWWRNGGQRVALLREAAETAAGPQSSCFPLLPFGNRVKDNRFTFEGRTITLLANTEGDRHYLHGDGWLSDWAITQQTDSTVDLAFSHAGPATPYVYDATQSFRLSQGVFSLSMTVTNRGDDALPFGLGWHPFFPMTPETTLKAPAERLWSEDEDWLPGEVGDIPEDLDFRMPRRLPRRWVNNGFENWNGVAEILWPERNTGLVLTADPLIRHAFLFVSDRSFDPTFEGDVFCFEPMSHLANGHNLQGQGDLRVLQPGESLSASLSMTPHSLEHFR